MACRIKVKNGGQVRYWRGGDVELAGSPRYAKVIHTESLQRVIAFYLRQIMPEATVEFIPVVG